MKIVLITGGFDPIHSGHIEYINAASQLGDLLIIGLNSDLWLTRKKGQAFMPFNERLSILKSIKKVHEVITFDDNDGSSKDAIKSLRKHYPHASLIFANGGDRTKNNIPELEIDDPMVEFVFGVGGNKTNSSSTILSDWKSPKTLRTWGQYRILYEIEGTKVKELTIEPNQSLSFQRHSKRNEYWFITKGACEVKGTLPNGYPFPTKILKLHDSHFIPVGEWHQLYNPYDESCHIVEIQYGTECIEEDIERK